MFSSVIGFNQKSFYVSVTLLVQLIKYFGKTIEGDAFSLNYFKLLKYFKMLVNIHILICVCI